MKYLDGSNVLLGDEVDRGGGMTGVVVCCFNENKFAPEFPKADWAGLANGVMVKTQQAGLIQSPAPNVDLVLVQSGSV